jgi:hypothetical protein
VQGLVQLPENVVYQIVVALFLKAPIRLQHADCADDEIGRHGGGECAAIRVILDQLPDRHKSVAAAQDGEPAKVNPYMLLLLFHALPSARRLRINSRW